MIRQGEHNYDIVLSIIIHIFEYIAKLRVGGRACCDDILPDRALRDPVFGFKNRIIGAVDRRVGATSNQK